jgi:tetratricopeptide (TPR) repeat protein
MDVEKSAKPGHIWLRALILFGAVILAYQPVWRAGFIWDDDRHITLPVLRSAHGLVHIWTQLGATQQYYPLVHSVFWVEHKLWGDASAGYHWLNILLHAFSALLLVKILRQLKIPGAWLAAGLFALHPVEVESVAWISELKNTLSGVFYLSAALGYLRFDRNRHGKYYALALGLFLLGLLSKTVIASLPVALLIVFWWQRGKLSWKQDVLPLIPFFATGIGAGLLTAWVERKFIGAEGSEFHFSLIERFLIAGRDIWFYLAKLIWPVHLAFIYPRWNVSQTTWWQHLFPAAVLLLLGLLIWRQWRGPLAVLLFFVATLFPALGFFNVYPFRYSFVADHFQYLASLGPLTLAAVLLDKFAGRAGAAKTVAYASILLLLGVLTWRQCRNYADSETLWRATLKTTPTSTIARNNLSHALLDKGQLDASVSLSREVLAGNPDDPVARNNLGFALLEMGRVDESISCFQQAIAAQPNGPDPYYNLGRALLKKERLEAAITNFQTAVRLEPNFANAYCNLGFALLQTGQLPAAITNYEQSIALNPNYPLAHNDLGGILLRLGDTNQARFHFERAVKLAPDFVEAHYNLGGLMLAAGQLDEALSQYEEVVQLRPRLAEAHFMLGKLAVAYARAGRHSHAVSVTARALQLARSAGETSLAANLAAQLHDLDTPNLPTSQVK